MTKEFLYNLVALQGGAIVSATECSDEEIEQARKVGTLAVINSHSFVYRGKIWMARVNNLLKQDDVKQTTEDKYLVPIKIRE